MGRKRKQSGRSGRRKRSTRKRRGNGEFKPITIQQACEIGHFSRAHFYRIKQHLDVRHDRSKVWVNEHSVVDYRRNLPR